MKETIVLSISGRNSCQFKLLATLNTDLFGVNCRLTINDVHVQLAEAIICLLFFSISLDERWDIYAVATEQTFEKIDLFYFLSMLLN